MATGIVHAHVATGTDSGTGEVHKAEWNAGHVVTTVTQEISADFTMATDSAFHDVTGMTGISLTAGTWIAFVDVEFGHSSSVGPVFRLLDGTPTEWGQAAGLLTNSGFGSISTHVNFTSKVVTLGGAGTLKLQYASDVAAKVLKFPIRYSDTAVIATRITFLQIG